METVNGTAPRIAELEFMEAVGGPNLCNLPATPGFGSATLDGQNGQNAFDKNLGT